MTSPFERRRLAGLLPVKDLSVTPLVEDEAVEDEAVEAGSLREATNEDSLTKTRREALDYLADWLDAADCD